MVGLSVILMLELKMVARLVLYVFLGVSQVLGFWDVSIVVLLSQRLWLQNHGVSSLS